jgi:hypothetical protein
LWRASKASLVATAPLGSPIGAVAAYERRKKEDVS